MGKVSGSDLVFLSKSVSLGIIQLDYVLIQEILRMHNSLHWEDIGKSRKEITPPVLPLRCSILLLGAGLAILFYSNCD